MSETNIIQYLSTPDYIVSGTYKATPSGHFTSMTERQIEDRFLAQLVAQGYERVDVGSPEELCANLRRELERLNRIKFSDEEWERFFTDKLANRNEDIEEKTARLQRGSTALELERDDGSLKNILLIDKKNLGANRLQVTNQYASKEVKNRYDVTILLNGLPVVQVELKKSNVSLKDAFRQIENYQYTSYGKDHKLFEYVQLFVISNGIETKYYSNSTRKLATAEQGKGGSKKGHFSASFEFCSCWADADNHEFHSLDDFTQTFFQQWRLLEILVKYCVFTVDDTLLVMRPYQIAATERIIQRVRQSVANKWWNTREGGGYVWHTTGSGKTLTSFKAAQIVAAIQDVDKVLFVVDRKDLDHQTLREYERFQEGAAKGASSSKDLRDRFNDATSRVIVTTIQKLQALIRRDDNSTPDGDGKEKSKSTDKSFYNKGIVFIFDECHRSQFGKMRDDICRRFKKRLFFGFTGTPIFPANSPGLKRFVDGRGREKCTELVTTEQVFGDKLHSYNIIDAINHKNVLKFKYSFVSTLKIKSADGDGESQNELVEKIDDEGALNAPQRIKNIVEYILKNYDHTTYRDQSVGYPFKATTNIAKLVRDPLAAPEHEKRVYHGFNGIFAVSSIEALKLFYQEFKTQLGEEFGKSFKVGAIFSCAPNSEVLSGDPNAANGAALGELSEENSDSTAGLDASSLEFLASVVADYNKTFGSGFSAHGKEFANYYKDLSFRVKNRDIDLLLVVDMFLTGFDAPALNTLWVDKNLRYHGLMQAFSRTNRILNASKSHGNIVSFRSLQKELDESLALFGNKDAGGIVMLRTYKEYRDGYTDEKGVRHPGYVELVEGLRAAFAETPIEAEHDQKEFVKAFNEVLRRRAILYSFDEFEGQDSFDETEFNNYKAEYLRIKDELRPIGKAEGVNINDDLVFEMELVADLDVDVKYILALVMKYFEKNQKDKIDRNHIASTLDASVGLRHKKELIERFIDRIEHVSATEGVVFDEERIGDEFRDFVHDEFFRAMQKLVEEEKLQKEKAFDFIRDALSQAKTNSSPEECVTDLGRKLSALLPSNLSYFALDPTRNRQLVQERVLRKFRAIFANFCGLYDETLNPPAEKKSDPDSSAERHE